MKFSKLAFRNVKKSYKDYFVYFMTLMFSVCLFYTFNSFSAQEQILNLNASQSTVLQTVGQFMNILSVFVAIVLAFLILYANNFLIRRRKQEFGVYMLLGMPKRDISKILVYETMAVGVLSLLSGLLLGILVHTFCTNGLLETYLESMGMGSVELRSAPFNMYVLYPLLFLLSAMAAQWLVNRTIPAWNIKDLSEE